MTGVLIRDTQFASWIDEDAWMETMKGSAWEKVLAEEEANVTKYTSLPDVKSRINSFKNYYQNITLQKMIPFQNNFIEIEWISAFFKNWNFVGEEKHQCRDLVIVPEGVFCTVDIKDGAEYFELQYWPILSKEPAWKMSPVGPDIAANDSKLFYLGVENKLTYHELWTCDFSGKNKLCMYREKSPEVNLGLHSLADGRILFSKENSQDFQYFELKNNSLRLTEKYTIPPSWILPIIREFGIDWMWKRHGFLITKQYGLRTLWKCQEKGSAKKLLTVTGNILVDPFAVHSGNLPCLVRVDSPTGTSYYTLTESNLTLIEEKHQFHSERIEGRSRDGTAVFGIITWDKKQTPKKLLAIGYGAYGMPTIIGSVINHWGPLVNSGWCILYTFLRGGGDHTEEWAKFGRVEGRKKTIEDFEGLILSAQQHMEIPPSKTVIYGRSAGGLLMGGSIANHPNGTLMSGVYAEVPYVDELRTTTNTDLPLTTLERREFGDPVNKIQDFLSVGLLSPADTATVISIPSIFVLSRTAEHDSQVFTYEPVKWIRRLRKKGAPKLCIVEKGQGHFTPPDSMIKQWSVDCALLDAWISGALR